MNDRAIASVCGVVVCAVCVVGGVLLAQPTLAQDKANAPLAAQGEQRFRVVELCGLRVPLPAGDAWRRAKRHAESAYNPAHGVVFVRPFGAPGASPKAILESAPPRFHQKSDFKPPELGPITTYTNAHGVQLAEAKMTTWSGVHWLVIAKLPGRKDAVMVNMARANSITSDAPSVFATWKLGAEIKPAQPQK